MPGVIHCVGQPIDQTFSTLSTEEQKSIPMTQTEVLERRQN